MDDTTRRRFTDAMRRRCAPAQSEAQGDVRQPGLFVVSASDPPDGYRWEIRKDDGAVLERSIEIYRTMLLARYAGVQALAGE